MAPPTEGMSLTRGRRRRAHGHGLCVGELVLEVAPARPSAREPIPGDAGEPRLLHDLGTNREQRGEQEDGRRQMADETTRKKQG